MKRQAYLTPVFCLLLAACTTHTAKNDADTVVPDGDVPVIDDAVETEADDFIFVEADEALPDSDIDMYCPLPEDAQYPYYREDGSIHFCRPCDLPPDDFDPDCVRSLWDDNNKEIYDLWKAGGFENNDWINECYPYPCDWNVKPITNADDNEIHQCDKQINPNGWIHIYPSGPQQAFLNHDKVGMYLLNGDIENKDLKSRRIAFYDIIQDKYKIFSGRANNVFSVSQLGMLAQASDGKDLFTFYIDYKSIPSKYKAIYGTDDQEYGAMISGNPAISDRWAIFSYRATTNPSKYKTLYAKVGEWKWLLIAEGYEGYVYNTTIVGDKTMFYDSTTKQSYLCDLSKTPKSVSDCTRLGRDGEVATFAMFNRNNANEVIYWVFKEGMPGTEYVLLDISTTPFTVKKSFNVPSTEETFTRQMYPFAYDGTILAYNEEFVDTSGTNYDQKICFYRLDEEKTYCSLKRTFRGHYGGLQGFASWETKYLFWQGYTVPGFYLRDLVCYCEKEGVCPFEGLK